MPTATIQAYTKQTLSKALFWLKRQPKDWAEHINADTAVSLYLKAINDEKERKKGAFTKELKKYCNNNISIVGEETSIPNSIQPLPFKNDLIEINIQSENLSPPAKSIDTDKEIDFSSLDSKSIDTDKEIDFSSLDSKSIDTDKEIDFSSLDSKSIGTDKEIDFSSLDSKSIDLIEKTKEGLNLNSSEEALRALLKIGYKSLKPLLES